jgi:CarD family transcriptional regulator
MYNVGDRIVYPMHGAGIIEAIEEKEILGVVNSYYVLRVPIGNINLMVPTKNAVEIGVRDVVSSTVIEELFEHIRHCEIPMNENWSKRYRENMDKIKSGEIFEIASIFKYLLLREKEKGLSSGEKKMLVTAKQIIVSEIMLSKDIEAKEAETSLEESACFGILV